MLSIMLLLRAIFILLLVFISPGFPVAPVVESTTESQILRSRLVFFSMEMEEAWQNRRLYCPRQLIVTFSRINSHCHQDATCYSAKQTLVRLIRAYARHFAAYLDSVNLPNDPDVIKDRIEKEVTWLALWVTGAGTKRDIRQFTRKLTKEIRRARIERLPNFKRM